MTPKPYHSYEEAASDYLTQFRALLEVPAQVRGRVTRGAGEVPVQALIKRADAIAGVSASMVPLAKTYLVAPDAVMREGISGQLLSQAAAELQLATELLQIASDQATGLAEAGTRAPRGATRAARGENLRDAITKMEEAMGLPISAGLVAPGRVRRAVASAGTRADAKKALQQTAIVTAGAISQRVVENGGDLAFNLVFNTEWAAVIQSAGLLSKDIAKLLDKLKEGASKFIQRVIKVATKTLLNVFDKILALLGRDVQDKARKKVKEWLDEIQKAGKIELFGELVSKLYQVKKFEDELPKWLDKTTVGVSKLNATNKDVAALSDKFTVLVGRINSVGDVIGLAKFIQAQFPQVLVVVTAIRIALLAVLVYGGYDYIGYGQVNFLNLTKGVTEVIRDNLGI
jgi:hypothetical protein